MLAAFLIAALPILASATPLLVTRDTPTSGRIQSAAVPRLCLAVYTASQPVAGDAVRLNNCAGPAYQATMHFEHPDIGGTGPIRYSDGLCFTAGPDPVNGDALVLGDCEQEWTFDSDGTIRAGNGQCVNIAKEDNTVQVWECNPDDEQGRFILL